MRWSSRIFAARWHENVLLRTNSTTVRSTIQTHVTPVLFVRSRRDLQHRIRLNETFLLVCNTTQSRQIIVQRDGAERRKMAKNAATHKLSDGCYSLTIGFREKMLRVKVVGNWP